ncbi:MAG: D-alanine--D-alanine ligase [Flavobacteriaceae bacterium]|nr:D-alanine--D-alanine ligase [Flavobacteriaceae bacterium]
MLNKNKSIIGIACGGFNSEKEISLLSGKLVLNNLIKLGWNVFLLIIKKKNWYVKTSDGIKLNFNTQKFSFIYNKRELKFDVVFNAIHGAPGENGFLASLLDYNKTPYTSSDFYSSALTFSKRECVSLAKSYNIPCAKSISLNQGDLINEEEIINKIGLPCFVKANRSGSSFGIYKVKEKKDLKNSILMSFKEDNQIIIESELKGREFSVGVYKNVSGVHALPITEIISENDFFDYEAKYLGKSEEITPANISNNWKNELSKMAIDLYKKIGLDGICRSDFILVDSNPHLIEINTVPGLTNESIIPKQCAAANIKLEFFFEELLYSARTK